MPFPEFADQGFFFGILVGGKGFPLVFHDENPPVREFRDKVRIEIPVGGRKPEGVRTRLDIAHPAFYVNAGVNRYGTEELFSVSP